MPEDFMADLIGDLRHRLDEIDAEKVAIGRALRALEGPQPRQPRQQLRAALIEGLRATPGSRASFLALAFGVSAASVKAELHALERSGDVVKAGLGWRLAKQR